MGPDELIRELCDRIVKSEGAEFEAALTELKEAIDSRLGSDEQEIPKLSRPEQA